MQNKATICTFTQESFLTGIAIQLDNGLILRTHLPQSNMAWCGSEKKAEIIKQFSQFIHQLEESGWEIDGKDLDALGST